MRNIWINLMVAGAVAILAAGCERPEDRPMSERRERVETADKAEIDRTEKFEARDDGDKQVYHLDPNTELNFTGYYVGGSQDCSFLIFDGDIAVYDRDPETAYINVHISMDSVMSESQRLTNVLLGEDFFDTANHPDGFFESSEIVRNGDGDGIYTVTGDLTLRGETQTISFPADIWWEEDILRITAEFRVDRNWWDLGYDGIGGFAMRDRVDIIIDAYAEAE